jgi:SAM-dependent methyltransferase
MRVLKRLLASIYPSGMANVRALDIGCGTGDALRVLLKAGATAIGVDFSSATIMNIHRNWIGSTSPSLAVASVESLPLKPNSFQLITSVTVLQHLTDVSQLQEALVCLRGILTENGRLIVLEIAPTTTGSTGGSQVSVTERSADDWRRLWTNAGLAIAHEQKYAPLGPILYQKFDTVLGWILSKIRPVQHSHELDLYPAADAAKPKPNSRLLCALRLIRRALKRTILFATWPLDHLFNLQGPSKWAYYRIFILKKS